MSERITIKMGVAITLAEIVNKLLYTVKEVDGKKTLVDRELPFRLAYRLNKVKMVLDKDVERFNKQLYLLLATYGEPTEDGEHVVIKDEERRALYERHVDELINTTVEHSVLTLEPEDLDLITDTDIKISPDAMAVFIGYMTNDPELFKDLDFSISLGKKTPKDVANQLLTESKEQEEEVEKKDTEETTIKKPRKPRKKKAVSVDEEVTTPVEVTTENKGE